VVAWDYDIGASVAKQQPLRFQQGGPQDGATLNGLAATA
jgi:hypothetical protein